MKLHNVLVTSLLFCFVNSSALELRSPRGYLQRVATQDDATAFSATGETFDQLIDHSNPALGTFPQRYWWSNQNRTGGNAPIILWGFSESAVNASAGISFDINSQATRYASAVNGAQIMLEHRYWGGSKPYEDLTAENLKYHTLDQAIQDLIYFASKVKLPFDSGNGLSNAPNAPWVLFGGSYPGALAAWTAISQPGTFWAYHGSSAPVQVIRDFWQFGGLIQKHLPENCTADINAVLDYVDSTLDTGTPEDIQTLQTGFNVTNDTPVSYFASYLGDPVIHFQNGVDEAFQFCDVLEGMRDVTGNITSASSPGPEGLGLQNALPNYQAYVMNKLNSPSENITEEVKNVTDADNKAWEWMVCNEPFGWRRTAAPLGQTTLFSRQMNVSEEEDSCRFYWNETQFNFESNAVNEKYGGWDLKPTSRLMLSNGELDPWRSASVHSDYRPGGPMATTAELPLFLLPNTTHCGDFYYPWDPDSPVRKIMDDEVQQISTWVEEFYTSERPHIDEGTPSSPAPAPSTTAPAPSATSHKPSSATRESAHSIFWISAISIAFLFREF